MLIISPDLRIPLREFQFTFARSSGPGGQNVNKVSSKATLRWPVLRSPSLPEPVRQRLLQQIGRPTDRDGRFARDQPAFPRCGSQRGRLPGEAAGDGGRGGTARPAATAHSAHTRVDPTAAGGQAAAFAGQAAAERPRSLGRVSRLRCWRRPHRIAPSIVSYTHNRGGFSMTAVQWWCSGVVLNRIFGSPSSSPPRPPINAMPASAAAAQARAKASLQTPSSQDLGGTVDQVA